MKSLNEVKDYVNNMLAVVEKNILLDPRGYNNPSFDDWMGNLDIKLNNIDTLVGVQIAKAAHDFVDAIENKKENDSRFIDAELILGLTPESDILKKFEDVHSPHWAEFNRDKFVQSVYESYGYTDILPTLSQIKNMKKTYEYDNNLTNAERNQLQKDIVIAREKLGLGFNLYEPDQTCISHIVDLKGKSK